MKQLITNTLVMLALATGVLAAEKPNILLIVADDLGWADVGWHGGKLQTPQMDKLVAAGVELDRHYVQPVCTPTRVALMSGRWTSRTGPHALRPSNLRAFLPGTTTLAVALKQTGYTTYIAGKWHLGSRPEWGPNHFGFDHSYGSLTGAIDPWAHTYRTGPYLKTWHRDETLIEEQGNATELVAKQVCEWMRAKHTGPWFIYVPFHAVHIPIDAPEQYKRLYAGKSDAVQRYGGFVSQLDAKIGEFVAALEETGQRQNTLIVFTSDNGGTPATANGYAGNTPPLKTAVSSNLPLRGHKGQLYEGGYRVAAFANWPGRLAPRKVTAPMHAADWMPTLTKLAGWKPATAPQFDGLDVWPFLTGAVAKPEPRTIFIPMQKGAVVLDGEWKLIAHENGKAELFHITADPYEKNNLAGTKPDRLKALKAKLAELRRDDKTVVPADLRGFAK
jgi:arylsulfatase A-like enzyme